MVRWTRRKKKDRQFLVRDSVGSRNDYFPQYSLQAPLLTSASCQGWPSPNVDSNSPLPGSQSWLVLSGCASKNAHGAYKYAYRRHVQPQVM